MDEYGKRHSCLRQTRGVRDVTIKPNYLSDTLNFNCKNTTMSDIAHYHKIVTALSETIRLMAEIDEVIETHGGWLEAFQTPSA